VLIDPEETHKRNIIPDNPKNVWVVSAIEERVLDGDKKKRQFDVMNRLYTEDNKPHHEHRNQIPDQN
jgi:hypothetical protein